MLDSAEIVIGGNGTLYVAPEGTEMPQYLTEALHADFANLGYLTDDGAKFTDGKTTNSVRPWQSFYPVRVHVTEREAMLEFTLLQWNVDSIPLAFGGGGFTQPRAGEYRYEPPTPETLAINALVLDIADGDRNFRVGIPRGFVTSNTESTFAKTGPALLPITFTVLANGLVSPWFIDSDDPAWTPAAS